MGALFIPRGSASARKQFALPAIIRPRRALATPPTITFGTATAGGTLTRTVWTGNNGSVYQLPSTPVRGQFGYARTRVGFNGVGAVSAGTSGVNGNVVTAGLDGARTPGMFQASFEHYGEMCELIFAQTGTAVMVKIDDEYVSLTPQALGAGGGGVSNYLKLAFGSRGNRRIDVIGASSFTFRGVNVEPGDGIAAAPIRGPRVIIVGDSFSQPHLQGWGAFLADAMGWDDVWHAGVGGTGWVATGGGSSLPFASRFASDVIPYAPDIVFAYGSLNDGAAGATAGANAAAGVAAIRAALPDCLVIGGYNATGGIETMSSGALDTMDAVKSGVVSAGGVWLNPVALPFEYNGTVPSTTIASAHAAGRLGANPNTAPFAVATSATGLYCAALAASPVNLRVGSTVEIGSGATRERVVITGRTQINGSNASYSFQGALQYAHAIGETVSEVGASYMTGTGQVGATTGWGDADTLVGSDTVHPSVEGQQRLAIVQAQLLRDWLARRSAAERAQYAAFAV